MPYRTRFVAVAVAASFVLAACGSRVIPLSQTQGLVAPGADPNAPLADAPLAPGTGPTGAPLPGASIGPGTGGTGSATVVGTLPDCVPTANLKEGVTTTKVKLGLIASLTGPLPGQFNSAVEATDSHVKMINDAGGICGRKFELLIRDDNGSGPTNLAVATKLVEEDGVFAFVGSVSAPDDSGIAKVSREHKIPDLGFPLTWARTENPYTYGVPGQIQRRLIGEGASGSRYLNRVNGIKQVAIFWLRESEVSILSAWAFEAAMIKSSGGAIRICHEQPTGVLDNNFTNYVVSMSGDCDPKSGPIAVYSTMENNANLKLATAMKEQGFEPKVFAPTFTSYLPSFIEQAGGATEGAYIAMPQIPFERLSRPQSEWTPGTYELKRYVDTLKRYHPRHKPPGSFGGSGWGTPALFFEMVRQCGAELTRACLFAKLDASPPFTAAGFLSPTLPRAHVVYTTDLLVQVRGGKFVEVRPDDKSGPVGAPDFWDQSDIFNWQKYFCANQGKFPSPGDKKSLIDEC